MESQKYRFLIFLCVDTFICGGFEFGELLTAAGRIVENKTHSKKEDIEHGPYKAKIEFIIINLILGQGTLYLSNTF